MLIKGAVMYVLEFESRVNDLWAVNSEEFCDYFYRDADFVKTSYSLVGGGGYWVQQVV